jgi:hypothetical protein
MLDILHKVLIPTAILKLWEHLLFWNSAMRKILQRLIEKVI